MNTNLYPSANNYHKTVARLEKSIRSGTFATYTFQKKQQLWNRLSRYAKQLGITIKSPIAAAFLAAGIAFAAPAVAQPTFALQTGTNNPLNSVAVANVSSPTFVDIDGDGDMDAFVAGGDGLISYYKNTGTATAPVFTFQAGAANPLNGINVTYGSSPTFVDIDNDGDKDLFLGLQDGSIQFYKNTGTASAPVFALQAGAANPLNGVSAVYYAVPAFVDIDGDGDQDVFIGTGPGNVLFYKNTGTPGAPVFVQQTGTNNPLNSVAGNGYATPAFADIDGDGDMDVIIGGADGTLAYYQNTGTPAAAVFTAQVGAANPFNGVTIGSYDIPTFVDIDGDGDQDAFIGTLDGTVTYYQNTTPLLPLNLVAFNGSKQQGFNLLQWQTASEINTKWFDVERSIDSRNFSKIVTVKANGSGNNNYTARDNSLSNGKIFYRLKMIDIDGRFTYSPVIWINSGKGIISLYPNPAADVIHISTGSTVLLKTNAGIYDVNGRLMQNIFITTDDQPVNVQQLAKGRYVIRFSDGTSQAFIRK